MVLLSYHMLAGASSADQIIAGYVRTGWPERARRAPVELAGTRRPTHTWDLLAIIVFANGRNNISSRRRPATNSFNTALHIKRSRALRRVCQCQMAWQAVWGRITAKTVDWKHLTQRNSLVRDTDHPSTEAETACAGEISCFFVAEIVDDFQKAASWAHSAGTSQVDIDERQPGW